MVTQRLLEQQYNHVARKYKIHVKETMPLDLKHLCGCPVCGCVVAPLKQQTTSGLPLISAKMCKKYHIHKPSILINKSLSNYNKLTTLFHEGGHIDCWQRHCFCMTCNIKSFQELHAMIFSLQMLMQIGSSTSDRSLISEMSDLHQHSIGNGYYKHKEHAIAAQMLKRSKVWKKLSKYLSDKSGSLAPTNKRLLKKMLKS